MTLTCVGDKFIIARWVYDANFEALRESADEDLVTGADIAVLRNYEELNALADLIKDDLKEFYDDDEPTFDAIIWSWHIPDEPDGQPRRMILFRSDEEVCTVYIEQITPIEPIRQEHS